MLMIDGDCKIGADYSETDTYDTEEIQTDSNTETSQSKSDKIVIVFGLLMFLVGAVCGYSGALMSLYKVVLG